jgi:hypothetical protein
MTVLYRPLSILFFYSYKFYLLPSGLQVYSPNLIFLWPLDLLYLDCFDYLIELLSCPYILTYIL